MENCLDRTQVLLLLLKKTMMCVELSAHPLVIVEHKHGLIDDLPSRRPTIDFRITKVRQTGIGNSYFF